MSAMVQRMLRLAQLEAMDAPPAVEPMEVAELLESARRRIAPLAERAVVVVQIDADEAPPVLANADATSELLSNLLDNALRHSPQGGRIALTARIDGGHMRFEVQDQGPGILPSERSRVFERFYTGDPARAARGGSGLGLAIARQLAERQGGHIWVADRTPGATLCFTLPIATPPDREVPSK
jgi:signal transduction histidine kinase